MQKKLFILIFLFHCLLPTALAQNNFQLILNAGHHLNGSTVALDLLQQDKIVKATVQGGKVLLTGTLKYKYEYVALKITYGRKSALTSFFVAAQNMQIDLPGEKNANFADLLEQCIYRNIPFRKDFAAYKSYINNESRRFDSISSWLFGKINISTPEGNKKYSDTIKQLRLPLTAKKIEYIKSNPDQYVALYFFYTDMLQRYDVGIDDLEKIYAGFKTSIKQSDLGIEAEQLLLTRKRLLVNATAPDFTGLDSSGVQYPLSKFKGQYVLLQFWASWCLPCKHQFPVLQALYNKYAPRRFNILAVAVQDREKNWKKSIRRYAPQWPNILDADNAISTLYDIRPVPQLFLINPDGKIVYHSISDNDNLDNLREVLFNVFKY
jgi:thiol-disulfide isomerase/thioredoxin